jgi:hypothetical protein
MLGEHVAELTHVALVEARRADPLRSRIAENRP